MADHSDIRFQAGQAIGQAQVSVTFVSSKHLIFIASMNLIVYIWHGIYLLKVKKDDLMDKATQSARETKEQAGGFIQQTGEQVKNMAQDAADVVKNAVGMGDNNTANTGTATTTTRTTVMKHWSCKPIDLSIKCCEIAIILAWFIFEFLTCF